MKYVSRKDERLCVSGRRERCFHQGVQLEVAKYSLTEGMPPPTQPQTIRGCGGGVVSR